MPTVTRNLAVSAGTMRGRIVTAVAALAVMTAVVGGLAAWVLVDVSHVVGTTLTKSLAAAEDARAAGTDFETLLTHLRRDQEPGSAAVASGPVRTSADRLLERLRRIGADSTSSGVDALVGDIRAAIADAARRTPPPSADELAAALHPLFRTLAGAVGPDGITERQHALIETRSALHIVVVVTLASLLTSVVLAMVLGRRILRPLTIASMAADGIARGKVDGDLPRLADDELGSIVSVMSTMRTDIEAIMEREVALRRSAQTRLTDALESSHDGIIVVDADLRIALANAQAADFLGAIPGSLSPGTSVLQLSSISRTSRKLLLDLLELDGTAQEALLGDGRWLRVSRSATREGGFIALCSDISVQKDQEVRLKATNLRLDAALDNMSQGLCLYGADGILHVVNRRFGEIFGLPPGAIEPGMTLHQVTERMADAGNYPGRSPGDAFADEQALVGSRKPSVRFMAIGANRIVGVVLAFLSEGGWLATFEDVTERRQAEERLVYMDRHDALTNLPNRVLLAEKVDEAVRQTGRGRQCAVFCLNLDHFKHINESLGHAVGDNLLRAVSGRLQGCIRDEDTAARLGGDEFAVVQTGIEHPEQAVALANRIVEQLGMPFAVDGHSISVGASIGISLAPGDGQDHARLLKNADVALSRAKEEGRGTWSFFEAEMDARLQARREIEVDIRRAVAEEQFEVYYQPQFDLRTDRIVGFEALIRWRHPVRGQISPIEFISLAEEIGIIRDIGAWVLRTACAEAKRWTLPLRVAVNVSPVQLRNPDFCSTVVEALRVSGLEASRLELEITESVMLSNSTAALDVLHQVRALGVQLSMDDFGTGYSSLTSLRSFPFDKIKIDKSFVQDLCEDPAAEPVIRAVIVLGAGLGIRITAEGVETAEQLARLRIEGCNEVQGYLISRPQPATEIPAMLDRWNAGIRRGLVAAVA